MQETDWSKVLGWPGYRVYRHEIDEAGKTLKLWVRRKPGNRKLVCSGCGRKLAEAYDTYEREVRDLPCFEFRTTVVVELYLVRCPDCGVKTEKVPQLPSKAPFSKRFEEAVGLACESAAVRRVARQFGLGASTVRAIDLRYLKRYSCGTQEAGVAADGSGRDLSGEETKVPHGGEQSADGGAAMVWGGAEASNLRRIFPERAECFQRSALQAACVDMHEPYRLSLEQWAPQCRLVYDKFHVMQHANEAVSEVRRAEFF